MQFSKDLRPGSLRSWPGCAGLGRDAPCRPLPSAAAPRQRAMPSGPPPGRWPPLPGPLRGRASAFLGSLTETLLRGLCQVGVAPSRDARPPDLRSGPRSGGVETHLPARFAVGGGGFAPNIQGRPSRHARNRPTLDVGSPSRRLPAPGSAPIH